MRICSLISTPFPPEEGIGAYATNLAESLIKRGNDVTLLTRGGLRHERLEKGSLEVVKLPAPPFHPFHVHTHGLFVGRWLKRHAETFDILHTHSPLPPAVDLPTPTVSTFHTSLQEQKERIPKSNLRGLFFHLQCLVSERIERGLIERSDLVTAVSDSTRRGLISYGINPANVPITPNGVDVKEFKPGGDQKSENRLLYTGRLAPRKGITDLLKMAKKLFAKDVDFELVITGKGPYRKKVQKYIRTNQLQDVVDFRGFVSKEELKNLYSTASVYVFPSHYEGLPTSLLEAMASGLPVVSNEAPGITDLIEHSRNGFLAQVGDVDRFTSYVRYLLESPNAREEIGKRNRQRVVSKFDWSSIAGRVEKYYRGLLA